MRVFKDQQFKKRFLHLLFPIFVQEVLVVLINTISSFIIGAVNQDALSGCNIANNVFLIFNTVLVGVAVTGSVFAAQYRGKNDEQAITKVFNFVLKLSIIWALIFTVISTTIPSQIINIFAPANPKIIEFGSTYLRFFSISFIFRAISAMYFYSAKNLGKTKIIIIDSTISLLLNTILCTLFVFVFNLSSLGAALSLTISRFVEMCIIIVYMHKFKEVRINFKHFFKTDKKIRSEIIRYVLPIFGARIAWSVGAIMSALVLGRLNRDIIAASSIITVCRDIIICFNVATSSATDILLGQELGAKKFELASKHGDDIMRCGLMVGCANMFTFMALCGIFFLIGQNILTPEAKDFLWKMMLIYLISIIPQTYNGVCHDGIFCAGGDKKFVLFNNLLPMWLITVPLGFISLFLKWPPLVTFFLIMSDEIAKFPTLLIHYYKRKWVKSIV